MRKRTVVGVISGLLILGAIGSSDNSETSNLDIVHSNSTTSTSQQLKKKVEPACNGTTITTGCTLEGIRYLTYVYHPAVPEKTHTETVTTYRQEISSYCTLCVDGTYSPSCATGSGACSHHGGVSQWNAPVYRNVPVQNTSIVIDAPAQAAYYEKVENTK